MIEIIIADDHDIVRSGLTLFIERENDMSICAKASSFAQIMELLQTVDCTVLVLDLNLGDRNGLASLESIHADFPRLSILVLSAYPDTPYAMQAYKAGAAGYLNKAVVGDELIEAIRTVARGEQSISRSLQETMPYGSNLRATDNNVLSSLSKREIGSVVFYRRWKKQQSDRRTHADQSQNRFDLSFTITPKTRS